jgi:hypothetical protein
MLAHAITTTDGLGELGNSAASIPARAQLAIRSGSSVWAGQMTRVRCRPVCGKTEGNAQHSVLPNPGGSCRSNVSLVRLAMRLVSSACNGERKPVMPCRPAARYDSNIEVKSGMGRPTSVSIRRRLLDRTGKSVWKIYWIRLYSPWEAWSGRFRRWLSASSSDHSRSSHVKPSTRVSELGRGSERLRAGVIGKTGGGGATGEAG